MAKSKRQLGRDEVMRRLKDHARAKATTLSNDEMSNSVHLETDRGAVIILGSIVEDALVFKLEQKMVKLNAEQHSRLFGVDAPLGTFSARIRMAYAMGIIDRDIVTACDVIREMRNACAHSRRQLSFEDAALRDALSVLTTILVEEGHTPEYGEVDHRKYYFGILIHTVCSSILLGREEATRIVNEVIADGILKARAAS